MRPTAQGEHHPDPTIFLASKRWGPPSSKQDRLLSMQIGDIHATLQCPARLRLLYSWEPAAPSGSTPRQLPPTQLHQGAPALNVGSILRDAITAVTANPESRAASNAAHPPHPQQYRPAFLPRDQQAGRPPPAQQPIISAQSLPGIQRPNAGVLKSAQSLPQPGLRQQGAAASLLQAVPSGLPASAAFATAPASQAGGDAAAGGAASALAPAQGQPADAVGVGIRKPRSSKAQPSSDPAAPLAAAKKKQPRGAARNAKKGSPPAGATAPRVPLSAVQLAAPSAAAQEPLAPFMWQLHQSFLAQPQVLQQPAQQAATPGFHPGLNGDSLMNFLDANTCTGEGVVLRWISLNRQAVWR